jgi:hypothetical protein
VSDRIIPEFCQGVTEFFRNSIFSLFNAERIYNSACARSVVFLLHSLSLLAGSMPITGGQTKLHIFAWHSTTAPSVLDMVQLKFCFSCSRQRSATSTGYVQEHGNNDYRVDSSIGGGSPTYDYSSSGYNSRLQQPAAQRRVNSEGELLSSYHRGDDGVMNYSMPMTGGIRYCISSFESSRNSSLASFLANIFTL